MMKKFLASLLAVVLALSVSSLSFSQEKMEGKRAPERELKSVSCDPTCGFMVRSHDEAELTAIVKDHAKKVHNMDMTDAKIKSMMKAEKAKKMKKEEEKKM